LARGPNDYNFARRFARFRNVVVARCLRIALRSGPNSGDGFILGKAVELPLMVRHDRVKPVSPRVVRDHARAR
jgi:hypothetical protein